MRLTQVEIEGYRSISDKVSLHIDRNVTVLLGANDHGKTNILSALIHLNNDKAFSADSDLNWDRAEAPNDFPHVIFHFELDQQQRESILGLVNEKFAEDHKKNNPAPVATAPETKTDGGPPVKVQVKLPGVEGGSSGAESVPQVVVPMLQWNLTQIPNSVRIERRGVSGALQISATEVPKDIWDGFISLILPRVEIIHPQQKIPDEVTAADLKAESHEFMRGIFYYAGLKPDGSESLFIQTNTTMKQLQNASEKLNETLKANWSQGKELVYEFQHAPDGKILLRIDDPSVKSQFVQTSRRSSGFTHFFALKTVLHARQQDHAAHSYIFLFDEPGIYLHPLGQYDLLQMLDAIGKHNQVLYSTHSLFMINKTFPARHRLIVKDGGTRIDGKPFAGRWGRALQELGYSLSGTILFAQHVLLAEGDSDPMLIQALFQKLIEMGKVDIDLNSFSVISTGDSKNTDALIRMLKEGPEPPNVLVLFDGDAGGTERFKSIERLLQTHNVLHYQLEEGTSVEDHMPAVGTLYVNAAAQYISKVIEGGAVVAGGEIAGGGAGRSEQVKAKFIEAAANDGKSDGLTKGIANWVAEKSKAITGLDKPSKVGIAREYIDSLTTATEEVLTATQLKRSIELLAVIQDRLKVPKLREPEAKVVGD